MNIFFVDRDPTIAAKSLCNSHVRKMFLESCNILLWPYKNCGYALPLTKDGVECKLSHEKHPATVWALSSYTNYCWLLAHTEALRDECRSRYKTKYKTEIYFDYAKLNLNLIADKYFPNLGSLTPFCRCFGLYKDQLSSIEDSVEAYREYYRLDKAEFARWPSLDSIPVWWHDCSEKYVDKNFKGGEYTKR